MTRHQTTILKSFTLSGVGLHGGEGVSLLASPAPENAGIFFVHDGKRTPALAKHVKDTLRGTMLGELAVVEHFLSAVWGLGLDNLQVEVFGGELPAMDGSARPFVEAIEKAGITQQKAEKLFLKISRPIELREGAASLSARPADRFTLNFMVDFPIIGRQEGSFDSLKDSYAREIAPARTFGYREEHESLKEGGRAKGASFENALVIGKDGYLNPPRFPGEVVRHKMLDLIGDLALVGRPLQAEIHAVKSGHKLNIELARRLLNLWQN